MITLFPTVVCKDGTTVSIQASENHYCSPREDVGPFESVEVGFPTMDPPESWKPYADGNYPCDVYGYVPKALVQEFIDLHGGVDVVATLDRFTLR